MQSGNVPADRLTASVASLAAQVERLERYVAAMSGLQKLEDRAVVARPTRFDSVAGMVEDAGTGLAAHADRTFALSVSARATASGQSYAWIRPSWARWPRTC